MALRNHNPLRSVFNEAYIFAVKFESNSTNAPDGIVPAYATSDLAIARVSAGTYKVTFAAGQRPQHLLYGDVSILEDDGDKWGTIHSYTASTGVLLFGTYSNSGGTVSSPDTDNKTIQVFAVFTHATNVI